MANPEHLAILEQGVGGWNRWRKENLFIRPDLSGIIPCRENLSLADLCGVNLNRANLSEVNLIQVKLIKASLCGAKLFQTDLFEANLSRANCGKANFSRANLCGADLFKTQLIGANLSESDLREADLSRANFSEANLSKTALMAVHALQTNFEKATLTGACIEDWNINDQTNFNDVICDYIYLKSKWIHQGTKLEFYDRRPHDPNKTFAPGEFAKLFQVMLETVDLIFSDGIEWGTFLETFQQLRQEINSDEIGIQAIERKGGAFVVRLEVPTEANKAEIERYVKQEYEAKLKALDDRYREQLQFKGEQVEFYQQRLDDERREKSELLTIVKVMAEKESHGDTILGNKYHQDGNIGIGHNEGTISGNARVAGVYNEGAEVTREDVVELLAELVTNLRATDALPDGPKYKAIDCLREAKDEAKKTDPDKSKIVGELQRINTTVEEFGTTATTLRKFFQENTPTFIAIGRWLGENAANLLTFLG